MLDLDAIGICNFLAHRCMALAGNISLMTGQSLGQAISDAKETHVGSYVYSGLVANTREK